MARSKIGRMSKKASHARYNSTHGYDPKKMPAKAGKRSGTARTK